MIDKEEIDRLGYLNVQRSRDRFLNNKFNKSKSISTVNFCKGALLSFDKFAFTKFGKDTTEQVIEDVKRLPEPRHEAVMVELFQKYLHWKHEESKASTSRAYYQTVVEYFTYHQLKINHYNLKRGITLPQDPQNMKHAVSYEEVKKLVDFAKPKRKALYTVLVSSGMRIGETLGLRKRDFDFSQDRICITIPAKLTKKNMQRQTYISKEAQHYLTPIIKKMNQDELVFTANKDNRKAVDNEILNFWHLRNKTELNQKYDDSTLHKITLHSFRAFFETHASNTHGLEYAHALIGHSGYLEQYYRLSEDDRLEKYIELEPKLTIGEDFRNKIKIQKLKIEKSEIERINESNKKLEQTMNEGAIESKKVEVTTLNILKDLLEKQKSMENEIKELKKEK
jgi:integrase